MASYSHPNRGENRKSRLAREARERQLPGRLAKALAECKAAAEAHDPKHYKTTTARRLIQSDKAYRKLRAHAASLGVR
jgi:hypothetical protein